MCCTLEPTKLTNTRIYTAEVTNSDREVCHVIGYQNSVEAIRPGPNAMLLPFPSAEKVGRNNLVNGAAFKGILGAYDSAVERLKPRSRSFSKGLFQSEDLLGAVADYDVFESGSYTIVLSDTPLGLIQALGEVPEKRRPTLPTKFIVALGDLYPDWPFALCCFEGSMTEVEPLFWWYKPRFPEYLFAPAIDAHDGNPPNLEALVSRDHTLAFASYASDRPIDATLQRSIESQVPREHRWMFDAHVCGVQIQTPTTNGDFVYDVETIRSKSTSPWLKAQVAPPPRDRPDKWSKLMGNDII